MAAEIAEKVAEKIRKGEEVRTLPQPAPSGRPGEGVGPPLGSPRTGTLCCWAAGTRVMMLSEASQEGGRALGPGPPLVGALCFKRILV